MRPALSWEKAWARQLREVSEILGVRVFDRILIRKGRFVSFMDDGYW
jgi:DNA repair protein RadC